MTRQASLHALALYSALLPASYATEPAGGFLRTWARRAFDRELHLRAPARGQRPTLPSNLRSRF